MRKVIILPLAIAVAGIFMAATSSQSLAQQPPPRKIVIKMYEVDDDHFKFDPAEIRLKVGEPVELVLANTGQTTHEVVTALFALPEEIVVESGEQCPGREPGTLVPCTEIVARAIKEIEIRAGRSVSVIFTPEGDYFEAIEKGETLSFFLGCQITGHLEKGMKGVIIVEK